MTTLALFAKITPKAEYRDKALSAIRGILNQTRAEQGCLRFELYTGMKDDPALYLVEQWTGQDALDWHYAQPYTARVFASYEGWLAEPVLTIPMLPEA